MKKLFLLFAILGALCVGCSEMGGIPDDSQDPTEQPDEGNKVKKIVINPATMNVGIEANDYIVAVTSPCSWRATTESEWITIETKLGIDGKRELIFSVAKNEEVEAREGKIVVSNSDEGLSSELLITQAAFVPEFSIDVEALNFTADGGEQNIEIVANFSNIEVTCEADWLTLSYKVNNIVVKSEVSNTVEERTADIVISHDIYGTLRTIKVTQEAAQSVNRIIYYTTSTGEVIRPYSTDFGGATILSNTNTYENNKGTIVFDNDVTSIGDHAFYGCSRLTSINIPNSVTSIGDYAFRGCSRLTSVTIPDGVTSIGSSAFMECSRLTSVTIGNGVTTIGQDAFSDCSSLTSVTIGNGVTKIGVSAFGYCGSLTSVTIGDGVTEIREWAFHYCSRLTSVTIPDGVTSIGFSAFSYCRSLTSVYCKAITPPKCGLDVFYNNASSGRKIYVPRESFDAYKAASGWKDYASSIVGYDF